MDHIKELLFVRIILPLPVLQEREKLMETSRTL